MQKTFKVKSKADRIIEVTQSFVAGGITRQETFDIDFDEEKESTKANLDKAKARKAEFLANIAKHDEKIQKLQEHYDAILEFEINNNLTLKEE